MPDCSSCSAPVDTSRAGEVVCKCGAKFTVPEADLPANQLEQIEIAQGRRPPVTRRLRA